LAECGEAGFGAGEADGLISVKAESIAECVHLGLFVVDNEKSRRRGIRAGGIFAWLVFWLHWLKCVVRTHD
jgi:hypothetical protein